MKQTIFQGVGTALITPFTERGIDFDAYGRLLDYQMDNGVSALIVAGTTGEGSVLSPEEHRDLIVFTAERVQGRVPVIAGTGANDTAAAVRRTKAACAAGADAVLLVTPYYNKTTQRGLIAHFRAIADESGVPCILYNVPSRTGLNMLPETVAALADHPRIAALKAASGNISQIAKTIRLCGDRMDIYSGNDEQTVPILSLGAKGVISVCSNVLPREMSEMCARWFRGDAAGAAEMQIRLLDLMNQRVQPKHPAPIWGSERTGCGFPWCPWRRRTKRSCCGCWMRR